MEIIKDYDGEINSPEGFTAAGVHTGIKKTDKDMAIIMSEVPAVCAGVFTQNKACAAPVHWDRKIVTAGNKVRAVLTNSGNANAATGALGASNTEKMAETAADCIHSVKDEILVCSTGVIGVQLPMDKILKGIRHCAGLLGKEAAQGADAADAICTTDTFSKKAAVVFQLGGQRVKLAGIAKGSGMIHPNMATMLAYITTDAAINRAMLQMALAEAAGDTFNMVSVDGDTSTNDTLLALANGLAGNPEITGQDEDYAIFKEALAKVCESLAKAVARDGEGATKLIEASVTGAGNLTAARQLARGIISSNLLKAAMFGRDANWGRVLCAMGNAGAEFDIQSLNVSFKSGAGSILVMENGNPVVFDEEKAQEILSEKEIVILIQLKDGVSQAKAWGCDLTYDYVKINGDYRS